MMSNQLLDMPSQFRQAEHLEIILRDGAVQNRLIFDNFRAITRKILQYIFWKYKEHDNGKKKISKFHSGVVP